MRTANHFGSLGVAILTGVSIFAGVAIAADPVVISPDQAAQHVGETVRVEGAVAAVGHGKGVTFLNFGAPHPNETFTAVIFRKAKALFPTASGLSGKKVAVTGPIKLYKGKPEIVLERADQLTSLD